ncbi:GNAT family N-acetyltransferase [Sphingomonas yunnanensis]|uniref:GNAT family N-acetyltransferase n=1 Tax=Sphingomonas yunnanensis TaxID=310400 RepID=UPI001CA62476|nr:GNAT family N-acetyltransferase [Sphingomonas yunnanensis]MBY9065121.1 GNAT family N-acetyltransferase [Sphingomonas yunnanensis]
MTLSIRPAIPADVPTMLRFVRELAAYEREPDAVGATEPMMAEALFGGDPAAAALIAERDGGSVGFALYFFTYSTWTGRRGLWLEDLYVTPEARGSGAGAALLRALAGVALDRGCARFEWTVLDWNTPAIDFYRAKGAVPLDQWTTQRVEGEALVRLAGRG